MSSKTRGLVLVAAGVALAMIALAADPLGLGGHPGIGWRQILGALAGVGAALAGLRDLRR